MSSTPAFPETNKDLIAKAQEAANQAAGAAAAIGRQALDRADESRGTVAGGMERTAGALRSNAPAAVAEYARPAADAVERAADYVRTHDLKSMGGDLTSAVRRNPGPSMIAAAAFGFLLGVVLRRER